MAKAIFAFRDLAANTPEMQRLALFFDHIFLWMPLDSKEISPDETTRMHEEIDFLRQEEIVKTVSYSIPGLDLILSSGTEQVSVKSKLEEGIDMLVPLITPGVKTPTNDDEAKWQAYQMHGSNIYSVSEHGNEPISLYHSPECIPGDGREFSKALAVIVKDFPLPPEGIPWQDFLKFKDDDENIKSLDRFRLWLRKAASQEQNTQIIADELKDIIEEYKKITLHHYKRYRLAKLSILLASTPAIFTSVPTAGAALLGGALKIYQKRLDLEEKTLTTPGREVSYFITAQDYIDRNSKN